MKFGKTWKESIILLPKWYRKRCIPYKKWKTVIKNKKYNIEKIESKLRKNIKNINYVTNCILKGGNIFRILHKDLFLDRWQFYIIQFIKLNAITLRKICKKLDKKYSLSGDFSNLYYNCLKYDFMKQLIISELESKYLIYKSSCSYCEDLKYKKPIPELINKHVYCPHCLSEVVQGSEYEETFERRGVYPEQI